VKKTSEVYSGSPDIVTLNKDNFDDVLR